MHILNAPIVTVIAVLGTVALLGTAAQRVERSGRVPFEDDDIPSLEIRRSRLPFDSDAA
jgi:hypothetical protein